MDRYHFVKNLEAWANEPKEAEMRNKAKIFVYIQACREGKISAFVNLQHLKREELSQLDILPEEFSKWKSEYKNLSEITP